MSEPIIGACRTGKTVEPTLNEQVALAIGAKNSGLFWWYPTAVPQCFVNVDTLLGGGLLPFDSDWNAAIWAWRAAHPMIEFRVTPFATPRHVCLSIVDLAIGPCAAVFFDEEIPADTPVPQLSPETAGKFVWAGIQQVQTVEEAERKYGLKPGMLASGVKCASDLNALMQHWGATIGMDPGSSEGDKTITENVELSSDHESWRDRPPLLGT